MTLFRPATLLVTSFAIFASLSVQAGSRSEAREEVLGFLRERTLRAGGPSAAPALSDSELSLLEAGLKRYRIDADPASRS